MSHEQSTTTDLRADREAAFEAAFLEHYGRIYAVLYRIVGEQTEAEDLAIEVFWRLWQWIRQDRDRFTNLGGWLYRVATRLGYNAVRSARRRAGHEESAGSLAAENTLPQGPEQVAQRAEDRTAVQHTLGRMRKRDASLLLLRHSGLSYREIAEALGVSVNSVGKLLVRAERQFEKLYSEEHLEDAHGGSHASQ